MATRMESKHLQVRPFVSTDSGISTGQAWEEWLEEIEREFRYFKIRDAQDKKDAMIIYGGRELARLEKSLPNPTPVEAEDELDAYEKLKRKLNDYYLPKKNKHHARYLFLRMKPQHGEGTASYAVRLREKASECDFGSTCEDRILEHLVQTIENQSLVQRTISKKWNLGQFLKEASEMEDTTMQLREMRNATGEQQVALVKARASRRGKPTKGKTQVPWKIRKEQKQCGYCGLTHEEGQCPAFGKKCRKCQKMNHFAAVCKSRADGRVDRPEKRQGNSRFPRTAYGVKRMTADEEDSASSDDEFIVKHLKQKDVKKLQVPDSDSKTVVLRLNDVDMKVEPDSGADVNLMDEHQFKALAHRTSGNLRLESSHTKLNTLQGNLLVKGEFPTILRNETRGTETKFIVVYGRIKSAPLIGKKTLETLGMIQIQPDGSLGERNDLRIPIKNIKSVGKEDNTKKEVNEITSKYQ
eukprot:gene21364-23444_t